MRKNALFLFFLINLLISSFFMPAAIAFIIPEISAPIPSPEVTNPIPSPEATTPVSPETKAISSPEATNLVSPEAIKPISIEAQVIVSPEAIKPAASGEALPPPGLIPPAASLAAPPEEGSTYKDVPWGCDFNFFKQIKGFNGNLGPASAGFVNAASDNDIALLLGVPVSPLSNKKEQRVMFEYVPQRFSCVYFAPDDVYYVFCGGKFSMVFSYLLASNFDLYRDNFYKKYKHSGLVTKQYAPSSKRKYRIDALQFERGKTIAFLIKSQETFKDKTSISAKMVLVASDFYNSIQQEIKNNMGAANQQKNLKLENDLKKIE